MEKEYWGWQSVHGATAILYNRIRSAVDKEVIKVYGVPRGGQIVSGLLSAFDSQIISVLDTNIADIIVDDIIDSGATRDRYAEKFPDLCFFALTESKDNCWTVFPWEHGKEEPAEDNVVRMLQAMGEDPSREGLADTPKRYLKFWKEFLNPPDFNFTTFEGENYDEMIISKDIPFFSVCEHHLAPFFGVAHIAYIPGSSGRIVGISKLPRLLEKHARRLQNQERITTSVAEELEEVLGASGVAVVIKARHLCQEMRGVKKPGVQTITSCVRGVFKDGDARNEFNTLLNL